MSSKYPTIQQHEPLRTPSNWGAQEKRFVAQLEEILDDIYRRFGRLKVTDLGDALRQSLSDTAGNINTLTQTAKETSSKIESISSDVSTLTQTDKSLTAAFESIGTLGKQTGITSVTEKGISVQHTTIGGYTELNADGMRMYGVDGNLLGGTYAINGKVYSAVQSLINPLQSNFYVTVAPDDYGGEQSGLHFFINGVDVGTITAAHNGTNGAFGFESTEQTQISSAKNVFISGVQGVSLISQADIEFVFYGTNKYTGEYQQMSLTASEIWNALAALLS